MTGDPCRPFADGRCPAIAGPVNIPLRSDASRDVFSVRGRLLIQYCIQNDNARIYSARGDRGFPRRRDQRGAGRVDPITLPDGTYCYDIMGGRSSSFLNVVSLAPVYFTGAIVTLQPLLRGWQTFVEIRNYGIYGKTDFDEWRERWLR